MNNESVKIEEESDNSNIAKSESSVPWDIRLGQLLKYYRVQNNLTLADVAAAAGTNEGILKRVENGQVSASIDTLRNAAKILGTTLSQLFRELESPIGGAQYIQQGKGMEVVRRGTKKGHMYELLAYNQGPSKLYEPFLITLNDKSEVFPEFSHPGTEFIYMLEGEMEYHHGEEKYQLKPGDSLSFSGEIPHGPEILNQVPIKFIAIIIYREIKELAASE